MIYLKDIFFFAVFSCFGFLNAQTQYLDVFEGDSTKRYKVIYKSTDSVNSNALRAYYAFDTSKPAFVKHFYNGIQNGTYKAYYPNGKLMIFSVYQSGKRHGDWTSYDTSGAVIIKAKYRNGLKHGFWTNRKARIQGRYKKGLKHGKWEYNLNQIDYYKKYFTKGKEREKQLFPFLHKGDESATIEEDSLQENKEKQRSPLDSIKLNYKGVESFHKIRYLSKDSIHHPSMQKAVFVDQPEQTAVIKYIYNGKLNGIYKAFYPNGAVYLRKNYNYGRLHGDWKEYNEKGELIIRGKYKNGKKHGKWLINISKADFRKEKYKKGRKVK